MPPDPTDLDGATVRIAAAVAHLAPGELAELRRMRSGQTGATFWRLYHAHGLFGAPDGWEAAVQAIALLTTTGRAPDKASAHDPNLPLGKALHRAGVSHLRIARLLAAPHGPRRVALIRLVRMLARDGARFDLRQLVRLILQDREADKRRLARDYYAAEAAAQHSEGERSDA